MHSDNEGKKIGMWLFLFTEIMLFGGLFVVYAMYHNQYIADFKIAGAQLNLTFGTVNTIILLTSSFTVAASITALRRKDEGASKIFLAISLLCAAAFLIIKYFEWGHKFELGIYPNSEVLLALPKGQIIFFGLYYVVTGLHGFHVIIGAILLAINAILIKKKRVTPKNYILLENSGLYWHLVDLVWIFVFPLFYLVH